MQNQPEQATKAVIKNIKKMRIRKRYTQLYMSGKLGISQNAYSKIELGYSKLTLVKFFKIAKILGVRATYLINGEQVE